MARRLAGPYRGDRLPPPPVDRLLHRDAQATNIIVGSGGAYRAILDWGCAGLGDPAWDCFGMPLRAVPFLLEGHREVAPLDGDETAEARILWRHLQWSLACISSRCPFRVSLGANDR